MANRAERRRQQRQRNRMNGAQAVSQAAMKRPGLEITDIQAERGSYSAMRAAQDEQMRLRLEAREQVRKIIEHNGITVQDLEDAREAGRQEGFRQAAEPIIKSCYAGICLALHDVFGFGESRCFRAIQAVDEKILWSLNHAELVDEVLEKTGLELQLDEPFDRVQRKEKEG